MDSGKGDFYFLENLFDKVFSSKEMDQSTEIMN